MMYSALIRPKIASVVFFTNLAMSDASPDSVLRATNVSFSINAFPTATFNLIKAQHKWLVGNENMLRSLFGVQLIRLECLMSKQASTPS